MSAWFNAHYRDVTGGRTNWTLFQAATLAGGVPGGSTVYSEKNGGGAGINRLWIYFRDATRPGNGNGRAWYADDPSIDGAWNNILLSIDTSGGAYVLNCYINGVSVTLSDSFTDGSLPFNIDIFYDTFYVNDWKINGSTQPAIMDMAHVWMAAGQFIDFSVQANREKFRSPTGHPVYLGADGSLPTGTAPTMYFRGGGNSFATNRGSGGTFTLTGTVYDASSGP